MVSGSSAKNIRLRTPAAAKDAPQLQALDPLIQNILTSRGVLSDEDLDFSLNKLLPFEQLSGVAEAVSLLMEALESQQSILVVGDFDADGATSTAVAMKGLEGLGFKHVDYLVPNRFEFGYGLSPEIVNVALQNPPDVIVTVDNGISSIEGVEKANQNGVKVIITDHHLPGEHVPRAAAIVNPNQNGCSFPSKNLAGVGVLFYLLIALRAKLREEAWFEKNQIKESKLAELLDLVALGTVADVVPLDVNNRRLVYQGVQRIRSGNASFGIQALLNVAKKDYRSITSTDLGFAIGPRLNAAGRLESMSLGIQCLLSKNQEEAQQLAQQLNELNLERRQIETGMQAEALEVFSSLNRDLDTETQEPNSKVICLYHESWHQGVVGIVASRMKEQFYRPVIIFAPDDLDGRMLKGSARSIQGVHIRDLLDSLASQNPGLIRKFGGHAMAAGLSLELEKLEIFKARLEALADSIIGEDLLEESLLIDGELEESQFTIPFCRQLERLSPWGSQFPQPLFFGSFVVEDWRVVGDKHLKLRLKTVDKEEEKIGYQSLDAIAFNIDLEAWGQGQAQISIAYRLSVNEFRGMENIQLIVEYID